MWRTGNTNVGKRTVRERISETYRWLNQCKTGFVVEESLDGISGKDFTERVRGVDK